jgi:alkanesulfonate monooxygenase SsuD/methylene tetrahydromethanopterin reductase-like flavin-dependent oxidoreductase (luciferase family)
MIGGGGEKKTLRMVAQYADESNLTGIAPDEVRRKLDALDAHCQRLGRDRNEITVSWQRTVLIAPTMEQALSDLDAFLATRGGSLDSMSEADREAIIGLFIFGDPDTVGEQLESDLARGVDGLTMHLPANGHIEGRVQLLGETAAKVVF